MNILGFREPVNAWSHGSWLLLSLPAVALLWRRGRGDLGKRVSLVVFGLSLTACFAGSTLYHGVRGSDERIAFFAVLMDYIGIYLLIAGTYTPIVWNIMSGRRHLIVLTVAWLSAAAAVALQICCQLAPPRRCGRACTWAWAGVRCSATSTSPASSRTARCGPSWPAGSSTASGRCSTCCTGPSSGRESSSAHELFHLFVMAGSLSHFWFILTAVATFDPAAPHRRDRPALPEASPVRPRRPTWAS